MQPNIRLGDALGNRFVLVDNRQSMSALDLKALTQLPIDQIVEILPERLNFYNRDGSFAEACGNGTRCAALWLYEMEGQQIWTFETAGGQLRTEVKTPDEIIVTLPGPSEVKFIAPNDLSLPECLYKPTYVRIGNPHLVVWIDDPQSIDLAVWGPPLENAFPGRVNVSFATQRPNKTIDLRVWERGVGATEACGTAACATHVSAHIQGLADSTSHVQQPGGSLIVQWARNQEVLTLTGPARLGECV